MRFEEKLINLRKQKGLSQEELAEQLGVSRQAVSRWELGQTLPDIVNLVQLCELFGVSADYLVKDEATRKSSADGNENPEEAKKKEKAIARIAKERAKHQQAVRTYYYATWINVIICVCFSVASMIESRTSELAICIGMAITTIIYVVLHKSTLKKIEKLDLEREELE